MFKSGTFMSLVLLILVCTGVGISLVHHYYATPPPIARTLAVGLIAGECGTVKSMVDFQSANPDIPGGAPFVLSYINSRIAFYHTTSDDYIKTCNTAITEWHKLVAQYE